MFSPIKDLTAIRTVVIAFGIFCGLTGIIAGGFELSQGLESTQGFAISTIGPNYSMWKHSTYQAYTILPNFLLAGIFSIILSVLVIICSIFLMQKKFGKWVFLLLSVVQLIVGGAFVIDLAIITFIISFGIHGNLNWWGKILPLKTRGFFRSVWPWGLILYGIVAVVLLVLSIVGVDNKPIMDMIVLFAGIMFIPMVFVIIGSIAIDLDKMD